MPKQRMPKQRMEHVDIRAPGASIKRWRARAKASEMSLSEWLRRVADEGAVYQLVVQAVQQEERTKP